MFHVGSKTTLQLHGQLRRCLAIALGHLNTALHAQEIGLTVFLLGGSCCCCGSCSSSWCSCCCCSLLSLTPVFSGCYCCCLLWLPFFFLLLLQSGFLLLLSNSGHHSINPKMIGICTEYHIINVKHMVSWGSASSKWVNPKHKSTFPITVGC